MPDYHFQGLSPHDFEELARDLLQAELGLRLESFMPGPDQGIDLRYWKGPQRLVVQCKHYPRADWSSLRRTLAAEVPKVAALQPSRYLVVTSTGLSPRRKDEIAGMFAPHCISSGDVLGREDLNNLLALHPRVERDHHKLWLTSANVLARVLNARVFSEQQAELEAIQRRVSRFVRNPSLKRALGLLDRHHFVVITGVPGIGKTTLAEMLLIEHLERDYELFRVWEGVEEVRAVLQRSERQLFYFDDFLGRTTLPHGLHRNEDERLVRLLREVSESPNTRVVLTTREYILHQARSFMEALNSGEMELGQCILDLGDYTTRIRAEILYNHLYFSDLPEGHLDALVASRVYRTIVQHRNYSPRILEAMTDSLKVRLLPAVEYPSRFVDALDNPERLWEVAYRQHLDEGGRDALLALASLPDLVRLADAETAFDALHAHRGRKFGFPSGPYHWRRALRELEGNFTATRLNAGTLLIEFHNPSVRDFMEGVLREDNGDVSDLIASAVSCQQVQRVWEILRGRDRKGVLQPDVLKLAVSRYWELRKSDSLRLERVQYGSGRVAWRPRAESLLARFGIMWDMAASGDALNLPTVGAAMGEVVEVIAQGLGDKGELVRLLERLLEAGDSFGATHPLFHAILEGAYRCDQSLEIGEFAALGRFYDEYPDHVSDDMYESLLEAFGVAAAAEEDAIRGMSDPDEQLGWFEELSSVAGVLGVSLNLTRRELEESLSPPPDEDDSEWGGHSSTDRGWMSEAALDALFDSLRGSRG